MKKRLKVLVTGGNGFIGSHLVDGLKKSGHDVVSYDIAGPYKNGIKQAHSSILDYKSLCKATKGIDVIYHLAAVSNVDEAYNNPSKCVEVNSLGTLNVLDAARRNSVNRVIFASTVWVYTYTEETEVDENSCFSMSDEGHIYISTKIAGELHCKDYKKLYGQDFTVLRYGIPYGERSRETTAIPIFIKNLLNGKPITIQGDGNQYRNFLYVGDLVEGNILAMKNKAKNQIYNLDGKKSTTIKELALTISNIFGQGKIIYKEARKGEYKGKQVSSEKARTQLGWEPKTELTCGLKKYIRWYKSKTHQS